MAVEGFERLKEIEQQVRPTTFRTRKKLALKVIASNGKTPRSGKDVQFECFK